MYKCCDCGCIFDEPVKFIEHEEYWGRPADLEYWLSPCCHEAFDEAEESEDDEDAV